MLEELPEAHGGLERWRSHRTARVVLRDRWPGWAMRTFAMPWPSSGARVEQTMLLGEDTSRLEFLDGELEGTVWGIQQWVTYTVPVGEQTPRFEADETIWFWLPTTQYFFEAPFRLREGQEVAWAGERTHAGQVYDLVYITWGGLGPQRDVDQYVAWIAQETGRLRYLEYTVRDMARFVTGAVHYEGYHEIDGIWVPRRIRVAPVEDPEDVLHEMIFEEVDFGVDAPEGELIPDPSRRARKSAQGASGGG